MRTRKSIFCLVMLVVGSSWALSAAGERSTVVWVDHDTKNIPEPKERHIGFGESVFDSDFAERWKHDTDVPHWVRKAADAPKSALNVNSLDEVPDSSWFTNRHALRPMTMEELTRGPNHQAPDMSRVTITHAKLEGVTPGLRIKDKNGESFLIKFDHKQYPELQSGAEVISTKILYAAGYNVPENFIAYLDTAKVEIQSDVKLGNRPFTQADLSKMLENAARRPDGTYRVLASKMLKGKPKGPFSYVGVRSDDPNDIIQHEHRRELRGLRVLASWINHWDLKDMNTLDMYVDQDGRKFLRHYLIDFGSTLGGGQDPTEYFHGREFGFDKANTLKEIFTLGLYVTPDEKSAPIIAPEIGLFSAADFDPENWKTSTRVMPFESMTREDAFWATRILLSFKDDELLSIVKTAQYSNPKVTDYIFRTLLERRRLIAREWLKDVNPIANFTIKSDANGPVLRFEDLLAKHELASAAEFRYAVANGTRKGETKTTVERQVPLGLALADELQIKIWTTRDRKSSPPVSVTIGSKAGGYAIRRIERSE
jgi:hypothetical protein